MRLIPAPSMCQCGRSLFILLLLSHLITSAASVRPKSGRKHISPLLLKLIRSRTREALEKRGCKVGLPCTYSHLSSMAAERTLRRMMADYMHNCVSDPHCSPGRRKRSGGRTKSSGQWVPDTVVKARGNPPW